MWDSCTTAFPAVHTYALTYSTCTCTCMYTVYDTCIHVHVHAVHVHVHVYTVHVHACTCTLISHMHAHTTRQKRILLVHVIIEIHEPITVSEGKNGNIQRNSISHCTCVVGPQSTNKLGNNYS